MLANRGGFKPVFCLHCGAEGGDEALYCARCGSALSTAHRPDEGPSAHFAYRTIVAGFVIAAALVALVGLFGHRHAPTSGASALTAHDASPQVQKSDFEIVSIDARVT